MSDKKDNKIIPFAFDENLVRTIVDEAGNFWFVAKDVCRVLEIEFYRDATARLDDDERGSVLVDTLGGKQEMSTISESGLYALVFRSRKPQARAFSKWVRAEVLPSLRKTGSYAMPGAPRESMAASNRYAMPDVPEMHAIRPSLRQKLWQDALQTARLDNAGADMAVQWFVQLCRMMVVRPAPIADNTGELDELASRILQFADEECEADVSGRIGASKLYEAFALWWCVRFDDVLPSQHLFGRVMPMRYQKLKRGGKSWYLNIRLAA